MPKKKFVLRLDEQTYKDIEKWANDEFRSVNGQIEYMLTASLRKEKRLRTPPPSQDDGGEKAK